MFWLSSIDAPSAVYCDNVSVIYLVHNSTFHKRIRYIEIDCHIIQEKIQQGIIHFHPVPSSSQLVDVFTKPLHVTFFQCFLWRAEKNGMYSVKSAYRLCVENLIDTTHLQCSGYLSGIWRLKVPPKLKNLMWRICWGCLPTRVQLQDKGVQCLTTCVSCDIWQKTLNMFSLNGQLRFRYGVCPVFGTMFSMLLQELSSERSCVEFMEASQLKVLEEWKWIMWSNCRVSTSIGGELADC